MPQTQHEIPIQFADGTTSTVHRTGNNAAWICACNNPTPILGYSDLVDADGDTSVVICPAEGCGRRYRVAAPGIKQVPTHVIEIR
ncbi:hypothetical protein N9Y42_10390 [Mariniblastus sp.]|nr:hypothetical protein [Mariniblastus sp.]